MSATALLATLRARGVRLEVQGGRLRVRAPVGTLTATDRRQLAAHKAELLTLLAPGRGATCHSQNSQNSRPPAAGAHVQPPAQPCRLCGNTRFWQHGGPLGGHWLCAVCHPAVAGSPAHRWLEVAP